MIKNKGGQALVLRKLLLLAAGLCAALAPISWSWADAARSELRVGAVVREHLSMTGAQPSELVITEADVTRGYVDVPVIARLVVRSNSRAGYALVFESGNDFVQETVVRGLERELVVAAQGAMATQPAAGPGTNTRIHELGFRFKLTQAARSGVQAWPLRMSVIAL